jgi:hypothetical protein
MAWEFTCTNYVGFCYGGSGNHNYSGTEPGVSPISSAVLTINSHSYSFSTSYDGSVNIGNSDTVIGSSLTCITEGVFGGSVCTAPNYPDRDHVPSVNAFGIGYVSGNFATTGHFGNFGVPAPVMGSGWLGLALVVVALGTAARYR